MDYSHSPVPGSLPGYMHLPNSQPMGGGGGGGAPASVHAVHSSPAMPPHHSMHMNRGVGMMQNVPGMHGAHMNSACPPTPPHNHSEAKMRLKACLSQQQPPPHLPNGTMGMMAPGMAVCGQTQPLHHQPHVAHPAQHHHHPHHNHHHHQPPHLPHHQQQHHHHQQQQQHHHHHNPHHQQHGPTMQQLPLVATPQPGGGGGGGGRRRRALDEDPDERRRKFLERNRAAATRCRLKRKAWVGSLEKKAEELTQTNMQLQNEVALLRNEVSQLKQLLMAHKDCPVSNMKKAQGYHEDESPTEEQASCSQQQVIQHVSSNSLSSALTQLGNPRTELARIGQSQLGMSVVSQGMTLTS
ncbi:cyclic AMP-responsive element-binding protein 5-like [Petromyzon marinus]|uniref:Cyclic AMP-responsive element-binding protein 5-like n=1 Tax=Petromyzon marinus TaxID=7757 RepID=A0AAJ7X4Y9_PETMA|nr:cyclic AMP-responsive element-binding protein 5-like [Petromyzon marinus]XP_032821452.1 cyclic AMP-responsive element-binding protein 5-like [Petromyzon marinus]